MYEKGLGTEVNYAMAEKLYAMDLDNAFGASTAQKNIDRVRAAAAAQKKSEEQKMTIEPQKKEVTLTHTSENSTSFVGRLLQFSDVQPARANIYDLVNHVFGCVDLEFNQLSTKSVREYLKEHYDIDMLSSLLNETYYNTGDKNKYNVVIEDLSIYYIKFLYDGETRRTWEYYISANPNKLAFDDCRRYMYRWKEDLINIGYSFTVKKDTKSEFEYVGTNNKKTVKLSYSKKPQPHITINVREDQ